MFDCKGGKNGGAERLAYVNLGQHKEQRSLQPTGNAWLTTRQRLCALQLLVNARVVQGGLRVRWVHVHALERGLNEGIHCVADVDCFRQHNAAVPATGRHVSDDGCTAAHAREWAAYLPPLL